MLSYPTTKLQNIQPHQNATSSKLHCLVVGYMLTDIIPQDLSHKISILYSMIHYYKLHVFCDVSLHDVVVCYLTTAMHYS